MTTVVIIPCLNEALTIRRVVADFRRELPEAAVVVIDNGSSDGSGALATAEGAAVLHEPRRGKGNCMRRALRESDADVYLLVDGDGTYPASEARRLVEPISAGTADVVIGSRFEGGPPAGVRWVNRVGNRLLTATANTIFWTHMSDLLTGYRAMSREFVRRVPILSRGFELEAELTILALDREFRTVVVPVRTVPRPQGSSSKLRVLADGFVILNALFTLLREYRPLTFFGAMGVAAMLAGLVPGLSVAWEFLTTHQVRIPRAVLATGLEIVGIVAILGGVILTSSIRRFREIEHQIASLEAALARSPSRSAFHEARREESQAGLHGIPASTRKRSA